MLKHYKEGEHFGEIAAFTQEPRKADVRATTFVEIVLINRRVFPTLPQVPSSSAWRSRPTSLGSLYLPPAGIP